MATVHFIQQGKGGVGKSMIASLLYQALKHFEKEVIAVDTDPVNSTLAGFREFDVRQVPIMKGDNIDARAFDAVVEMIFDSPTDAHIVIDNGASSFVALGSYLLENSIYELLQEHGHTVYFHTVMTGGQAVSDTANGLKSLAISFPKAPIVVWLNPFFGEIALDGKKFVDFKVYKEHAGQFEAIIELPEGNRATIGKDLEELFAKRMSFEAGINSSKGIVVRARLRNYWKDVLNLIQQARFAA